LDAFWPGSTAFDHLHPRSPHLTTGSRATVTGPGFGGLETPLLALGLRGIVLSFHVDGVSILAGFLPGAITREAWHSGHLTAAVLM
jgi:hypothetical protein